MTSVHAWGRMTDPADRLFLRAYGNSKEGTDEVLHGPPELRFRGVFRFDETSMGSELATLSSELRGLSYPVNAWLGEPVVGCRDIWQVMCTAAGTEATPDALDKLEGVVSQLRAVGVEFTVERSGGRLEINLSWDERTLALHQLVLAGRAHGVSVADGFGTVPLWQRVIDPVTSALVADDAGRFEQLLPADVEKVVDGLPLLCRAAAEVSTACVVLLVRFGADPNRGWAPASLESPLTELLLALSLRQMMVQKETVLSAEQELAIRVLVDAGGRVDDEEFLAEAIEQPLFVGVADLLGSAGGGS